MRVMLLLAPLVGFACASEGDEAVDARCPPLRGTYVIHYEPRFSGGCGTIPDEVVLYGDNGQSEGSSPATGAVCNAPVTYTSSTGCEASLAVKCSASDGSWQSKETIDVKGTADGKTATGVYEISVTGAGACESTYDVTYRRR